LKLDEAAVHVDRTQTQDALRISRLRPAATETT
jgi:hypothetical protein